MMYLIAYFLIGFVSMLIIRKIEGPIPILIWIIGILLPPVIVIVYIIAKLEDVKI